MAMTSTTIIDTVIPAPRQRTTLLACDIALIIAGSLLLALSSRASFYLFSPYVPITMQPFVVMLLAATLGSRRGTLTMLLFLAEGATGLPVFVNGGGIAYLLMQPTAGYLFAYPVAAFLVGWCCERGLDRRYTTALWAMLPGLLAIYLIGLTWLTVWLHGNLLEAFTTGVLPFVVPDLIKLVAASLLLPLAWSFVRKFRNRALLDNNQPQK
ncbi:MAG TPA: biotin transporter BioY [Ktedonobacteraceae bacterium]|jgi:biotin transport system substrate-specific component